MDEVKINKIITLLLAMVICIAAITVLYVNLPEDEESETDTTEDTSDDVGDDEADDEPDEEEPEKIFTLIYGEEQVNYTLEELVSMESITGYAGYRTSLPAISGQGTYTGIEISTLVENIAYELVNYSVIVTSDEDGLVENKTYDYEMIQGNLDIYNATNASDDTPIDTGNVTMILCYMKDGEYLDESDDGILKIAFINEEEELITKAGLWWKFIVSIEIIEE
jgi:hypothetical protein